MSQPAPRRAALALHCSLAHGGAWAGLAAALPELDLAAPDLPGHGRAADLAPGQDLHDEACRVARAAMGEGPVLLIGHSFGATVALRLALEAPERVRQLVLIEPVLFSAARGMPEFDAFAAGYAAVHSAMTADSAKAAALFHSVWGHGDFARLPPAQRDYMAARMPLVAAQDPVLVQDRARLVAPGRLEALDLPVLLLEGSESPPIVAAIQSALAARLPQARRAVVPGAAHMLPITHPREVAELIRASLGKG
ncbi:MAG: alpha/beta fold hydrolase [Gemmobacter sp.]|uniref:alpha/beta fold hydrolase n=1 Tax=Gemmobacter sp. TaxID=1898957 RepID=UPI001A644088|nr:alpha/beta hydrolase [Gemmobacter sp.]MBL8562875.1 alpha/beta fold hydrolase [Gemmobacter sp.]